jgi:hypothetical protein
MNRLLTALATGAMVLSLGAPSFAAATPKPMKSPMSMASPMAKMSSTKSCPKGESYVKGYTKSNGTKVKGYCRKSA